MNARAAQPRTAYTTRLHLRVTGTVQGVGFRPFVYRLATGLDLVGWVRNTSTGAEVEVQGPPRDLRRFSTMLHGSAPPLCKIDGVESRPVDIRCEASFAIIESEAGIAPVPSIPADVATCADCEREIADPADRRYRYPFNNCTNCGPRLSIIL